MRGVGGRFAARLAGAALVLAAIVAPLAGAAKDETTLVSRQSAADGGAGGDDASLGTSISADGRYVAFGSNADNLSAADNNTYTNIFVRDLQSGTTTLVSRQSAGDGGAGADGGSSEPAISADGRHVAFASAADNLSGADDDGFTNIFVRDLQSQTTTLVSRQSAADGGAGAVAGSDGPSISADGRQVAFVSAADNLSTAANNTYDNVFVRDIQSETTTLVSRQSAADGGAGADGNSTVASISADGGRVAFASSANNLSSADADAINDVFVRDLQANTTTLVSRRSAADGGAGGDNVSADPSISADGRQVAFFSSADNLSTADNDSFGDVFVRDLQSETTTLVSRQSAADGGAGADGLSDDASISADGRHVAFRSRADNLSAADNDSDLVDDIYVRDTQGETTTLVSRQSAADGGAGGDGGSLNPSISADGRYVAFASEADNLSAADNDSFQDVFVRDVLGDTTAPVLVLDGKAKQKLGKKVKVKATCDEACSVVATGTAKPRGSADAKAKRAKKLKLKRATADLAPGVTQTLKLKSSKRVRRKLKAAAKAKVKISATATDAEGNPTEAKLRLKLR